MINRFVGLTDAESILSFAKDWGTLGLSKVGQIYLPSRESTEGREPLSGWQFYSRRARAILSIAAALKEGKLGDISDWDQFVKFFDNVNESDAIKDWEESNFDKEMYGLSFSVRGPRTSREARLTDARQAIATEVNDWLDCWKMERTGRISDLSLYWTEDQKKWSLQVEYHGQLFPAIALQLALVLADADSLFNCSGCGMPYIRPRARKRPKSGWANYCEQCSKSGVARRRATENYREKKAEALRLHLDGRSASEIAGQLSTDEARIGAWLEKGVEDAQRKTRKQ
jgi:hypothetical protein